MYSKQQSTVNIDRQCTVDKHVYYTVSIYINCWCLSTVHCLSILNCWCLSTVHCLSILNCWCLSTVHCLSILTVDVCLRQTMYSRQTSTVNIDRHCIVDKYLTV
jgi:uncharacterized membrane protein